MPHSLGRKVSLLAVLCLLLMFTIAILIYFGLPEFNTLSMIVKQQRNYLNSNNDKVSEHERRTEMETTQFWRYLNVEEQYIPENVKENWNKIQISDQTIDVEVYFPKSDH